MKTNLNLTVRVNGKVKDVTIVKHEEKIIRNHESVCDVDGVVVEIDGVAEIDCTIGEYFSAVKDLVIEAIRAQATLKEVVHEAESDVTVGGDLSEVSEEEFTEIMTEGGLLEK